MNADSKKVDSDVDLKKCDSEVVWLLCWEVENYTRIGNCCYLNFTQITLAQSRQKQFKITIKIFKHTISRNPNRVYDKYAVVLKTQLRENRDTE